MALDGVTISSIVLELKQKALGGRIDKASQPEKDEIILGVRSQGSNAKLLMTASASHPRLHFTEAAKTNPLQAPLFVMVLRKYIVGGRIVDVTQPNFERVVELHIESLNEMGDLSVKRLIIEIMGKHSNIILTDERGVVIDAVKRVSHETSALREVLPGKTYAPPPGQGKLDPTAFDSAQFLAVLAGKPFKARDAFFKTYTGISPFLAEELCFRAGADPDADTSLMPEELKNAMAEAMAGLMRDVRNGAYNCAVLYENGAPKEFTSVTMSVFGGLKQKPFESASAMLDFYYCERDALVRFSQKTSDIRRLIQQNIERCVRKKELYEKTLRGIADRDALKLRGELLTANIHSLKKGMTSFTTVNYNDENLAELTIPLDPNLTPSENTQKIFKRYNKEKRTFAALQEQIKQNDGETAYLEGLFVALETCRDEADIEELRDEMAEQGFAKTRQSARKGKPIKPKKSKPLHYVSTDGFQIYVGKNNRQNDELTLRFAENGDIWFHAKDMPGSHVILQTMGQPVPASTVNEAALLAAYHSKGKRGSHVPVDYTVKKNVKKPGGAKPGMVIYDRYQTAYLTPDEETVSAIKQV